MKFAFIAKHQGIWQRIGLRGARSRVGSMHGWRGRAVSQGDDEVLTAKVRSSFLSSG